MSDTSLSAIERLQKESPVMEAVTRELEGAAESHELPLAVGFAGIFYSKATRDLLQERTPEELARMALGAFRFLARGGRGPVAVEVFNPDIHREGWEGPVTVIRTNVTERPFIVDTLREFLHSRELAIEHNIYPVVHLVRDGAGRITELLPSREGSARESLVHCEVSRIADPAVREELAGEIHRRLMDVVRATDDFRPMLKAVERSMEELRRRGQELPERTEELEEVRAFLRWLKDGAFVFLGYRGYDVEVGEGGGRSVVVEKGSGLGILRREEDSAFARPVPLDELPAAMRELAEQGPTLIISKANAEATVHRRARMDYIGVKKLDASGEVVGEHRFLGLFTSRAYGEEAERIPILRQKLREILVDAQVAEGSHDYKEINTIFNSLPKEELFLGSAEEIGRDVRAVLTSYGSDEVLVTLRDDPLRRGVSVMVILPKDRFSGSVRRSIEEAFIREFQGEVLNYHLALGAGDQARLHFYVVAPPERVREVDVAHLEEIVQELIRSWEDRVREGLEALVSADEARRLATHYGGACSPEYRAATAPAMAVKDIQVMEGLGREGTEVAIALSSEREVPTSLDGEEVTALKLYLRGGRLVLSDFMPILENAGLRVIAVSPFEIRPRGRLEGFIYVFAVQDPSGHPLEGEVGERLSELILAVRAGDASNDALNALVVSAGLSWREVELLRTYATYAFQLGAVPSRLTLPGALRHHPQVASLLMAFFRARFNPSPDRHLDRRRAELEEVRERFREAMEGVTLLAEDRALRRLLLLMEATLRTNYYSCGGVNPVRRSGGVPYISLKLSVEAMGSLNRARLRYEIWVRSPRMEGIHLRGARVARGGIRWSDRPDDFRTEVAGLVKTQMVKNAVIVPAGSKGGFVTLRQLDDPEAQAEEGKEQYRTLVRGLLDLTDNLVDGEPVPPGEVVCWDDPDPYLVVAADKGTARFSDVANEVAAEYGFWLGDAFASGGSHGYDHKKVGITARGAWECVRRHFREMGKDIQEEPFTVVGVGDLSGDVFGNGMLLSRKIRLVAAFDHRHIFLDPDPDPETSYRERERVFALGSSSWLDYDASLLSPGGAIIPRGAKQVSLDPRVHEVLGIEEGLEIPDGEFLIRHILRAPVELLWNGGIGTYVKSSKESHGEVGDASNDAVRVNAADLRVLVVGEGGNLGFTQRARIEYALNGGRINTDALDNSAGVDLSDHEVNLKILLGDAVTRGRMGMEERNRLLVELTDPVAELVLQNNRSQSLAVTLGQARVRDGIEDARQLMTQLEREGMLDRADEELPSWEALLERLAEGKSLTRPELCILLAYGKMHLTSHLLRSGLPDDPGVEEYLLSYFPTAAREATGADALGRHRLRREIIAGQITNDLVDLMGSGFVMRIGRDTGRAPYDVTRCWLIAARLAGHREVLDRLRTAPDFSAASRIRWTLGLARVLERTTRWLLIQIPHDQPLEAVIRWAEPGVRRLQSTFHSIVAGEDREVYEELVDDLTAEGADPRLAQRLVALRFLDQLLEILRVADRSGAEPLDAAGAFYRVAESLQLPWLRLRVSQADGDNRWEQRMVQGLLEDLTRAHHRLAVRTLEGRQEDASLHAAADRLVGAMAREVARFRELIQEIQAEETVSVAAQGVAVRELVLLADRLDAAR